jgi:ribosomal protein L32
MEETKFLFRIWKAKVPQNKISKQRYLKRLYLKKAIFNTIEKKTKNRRPLPSLNSNSCKMNDFSSGACNSETGARY